MRSLGVMIITLLLTSTTLAQDYDATATAIIIGATQTTQFQANNGEPTPTPDSFQTTATALVRQATQTAEASTGNTAVPVTSDGLDQFELTATALINQVTQTAQASKSGTSSSQNSDTNDGDSALSVAAIIVGALIAILTAIGGALGLTNNNKSKNNG